MYCRTTENDEKKTREYFYSRIYKQILFDFSTNIRRLIRGLFRSAMILLKNDFIRLAFNAHMFSVLRVTVGLTSLQNITLASVPCRRARTLIDDAKKKKHSTHNHLYEANIRSFNDIKAQEICSTLYDFDGVLCQFLFRKCSSEIVTFNCSMCYGLASDRMITQ